MFVLSNAQFLKLLRADEDNFHRESLLDLGAGDGEVTKHFSQFFETVYVTELSNTMQALLQKRGFRLLDVDKWNFQRKFDVISCLNLVDRCDRPQRLLQDIKGALQKDGLLVLAVVLPFAAYVEGARDHKPKESLNIEGRSFEEQVESFVEDVLMPAGFEIVSWTRVPYLCEGDLQQSYYWLDDVVFVLKLA